ncbi:hypothetical protein [Kitasatospora atroaurantiaca]|uniref:hypothetical protein n=1 Tax=Kitasatospora atroaurantiaca TaxID=285545 RepID=UPI0011A8F3DE
MSTYLALTFGTLLSSQGTDASFESLIKRTLCALRSFLFPAYQMFSGRFTGFRFSEFPLEGFPSTSLRSLSKALVCSVPGFA